MEHGVMQYPFYFFSKKCTFQISPIFKNLHHQYQTLSELDKGYRGKVKLPYQL